MIILKNNDGFTLVELLTVIAILSMISLIAVPSISNMYVRKKDENEKKVIESILDATQVYVQMNDDVANYINLNSYKCIRIDKLIEDGAITNKEARELDVEIRNQYVKVSKKPNEPLIYEYVKSGCS